MADEIQEIPTDLFSPRTVEWLRISRNIHNYAEEIVETLLRDNRINREKTEDLYRLTSGPSTNWISSFASYVNAWIFLSGSIFLVLGFIDAEWSTVYCCACTIWLFSIHLYFSFVSLLSKQLRKADEQFRIYCNVRGLVSSLEYWQRKKGFWERETGIRKRATERGLTNDADN